jgi:hypothetical protein
MNNALNGSDRRDPRVGRAVRRVVRRGSRATPPAGSSSNHDGRGPRRGRGGWLREPSGPPHGDRQLAVNDRLTETVVFHVHNCVMHPMATHELQSSASEGSGLDSAIRTAPDPIEPPVEQTGESQELRTWAVCHPRPCCGLRSAVQQRNTATNDDEPVHERPRPPADLLCDRSRQRRLEPFDEYFDRVPVDLRQRHRARRRAGCGCVGGPVGGHPRRHPIVASRSV